MSVATSGPLRTAASVVDLIGNTPLIRLTNFEAGLRNVELYAKAEWRNPGGSVKDRPAARMIADGERSGLLTHDKVILDATSGNTGIAYAMIGAARGYRVRLCVPGNVTPERKRILRAFGAEVIFTDPMQGSDGAIIRAKELYAADPDGYFYADQYNNPGNWRAHYDTTAPEILEQTGGRLTHFVAGLGTSGTFVGVGRRLREVNPSIRLISVQPDSPLHGLEGLKHMETAIVPGIYDPRLADQDLGVSTEEAHELTRRLAQDGLFVGISSGANLAGALRVARSTSDAVIVVVFCDGGEKVPLRSFLGREHDPCAGAPTGCRAGHPRSWSRNLSQRVLWRAVRPRRRGHRDPGDVEHHRRGAAPALPGPATGLYRGRAARLGAWRRLAWFLSLASRSSCAALAGPIWITHGRSSRTSSFPFARGSQRP